MPNVVLPPLHPMQKAIADDPSRFKVLACGRRWGKTRMAVSVAIRDLLEGKRVMWVGPSYQIASVGWRSLEFIGKQLPGVTVKQGERKLIYKEGWVQIRSADSEGGLRGEGLDLLIVDECAHVRDFQAIWEQELRPALSDRKGRAIFISTPKGYNHFYELFKCELEGWKSWQMPTYTNPYMDQVEIDVARGQLPDLVFRQEYEAEFVQLAGAMFHREYFEIVETLPKLKVGRHWDLAASTGTKNDYSVGCKGGVDQDGNVYILDVVRGRWEWPALIRVFKSTALSDDCPQSVETAGTQKGFLQLLMAEPQLMGISIKGVTPHNDKITRAQPLVSRAEHSKIRLLRGPWNQDFINELCAFPEVDHDDQVDATTGMLLMLAQSPITADQIENYRTGKTDLDDKLAAYAAGTL